MFRRPMLRWCVVAWFIASFFWASQLFAEEIEVRLVAGDRKERPLVSDLVDFRRSPDGGLIATGWLSGVQLGEKPLFPVQSLGDTVPDAPKIAGTGASAKLKDDTDSLLDDIKKELGTDKPAKSRPVDRVDPQYRGKRLADGRTIGPQRTRASTAKAETTRAARLTPGDLPLPPRGSRIDVPCFPVTITAVTSDRPDANIAFAPQIAWQGRDLLADCLFEHSPDLPLGDFGLQQPDTLIARLEATRGGQRLFRRLTFYLPASGGPDSTPYTLNGQPFWVESTGVRIAETNRQTAKAALRQAGKFAIEIVEPASRQPRELMIPVSGRLTSGWSADVQRVARIPAGQRRLTVKLTSPAGELLPVSLDLPSLDDADRRWHPHLILAMDESDGPAVYFIGVAGTSDQQASRIDLLIRKAAAAGALQPIAAGALDATLGPIWEDRGGGAKQPRQVRLIKSASADEWSAMLKHVPAGLYGVQLKLPGCTTPPIPVVVADKDIAGSVSLLTYHNRCDYRRGEQVQLGLITRATAEIQDTEVAVQLKHETGEVIRRGRARINCPAGEVRSLFLPIDTTGLRLGRYVVTIEPVGTPDAGLIRYPAWFKVYPAAPRTNFALYSWMIGSFSGPMMAGDKTLINLLLSQRPTQFLTPRQVERHTDQGIVPARYESILASDPLYPAPEACLTYDDQTEREAAAAMRLGLQYGPDYGWGMNGQEAAWNPKHTLPEELARIRRLCSQVTQRHRDFGNFAGLHLNWYPGLRSHWEAHPNTDGNAGPRRKLLAKQAAEVYQETEADRNSPRGAVDRAVRTAKFRIGALPRAYDAWTEQARKLQPGMIDHAQPSLEVDHQPGLTGPPVYTSFLPVSWSNQHNYYPPVYFSKLPVAAVHAYTDFGFSPYQPLWAIDRWAAGVGDKPVWITTMSNGRDIMLRHALLAAARGADGIDINGQDLNTAEVLSDFLSAYGPMFRTLRPESDVAIVTSLGQQTTTGKPEGVWMGYTGGPYFNLYTQLWYAGYPPATLPEDLVSLDRLKQFKAVFLVHQKTPLPAKAVAALREYIAGGGHVFKDGECDERLPGAIYGLQKIAASKPGRPKWQPEKYRETRDRFFVGTQAGYESIGAQLDQLLSAIPPPRVQSSSHNVLVASLGGRDVSVVFAVNGTKPWPGIHHPWNFWSATVMATKATLSFDRPYVLYDLLEGGQQRSATAQDGGRYTLPVSFDRCAGRAYILTASPIVKLRLRTVTETAGGMIPVEVAVIDQQGRTFADPMPCEILLMDDHGRTVQQLYRALGPGRSQHVRLPWECKPGKWQVRVRELASGRTATATVNKLPAPPQTAQASEVLVTRRSEVIDFLTGHDEAQPLTILLDESQLGRRGPQLEAIADKLAAQLAGRGRKVVVQSANSLELVEVPQRWRPNQRDKQYLAEAKAGKRVVVAASLAPVHKRGNDGAAGALDPLHPASGFSEPGARHRIFRDVILLGSPADNRFLDDLHATVGQRATGQFPAPGSALVQVIYDAFTPHHDCLSIQAHDAAGIERAVETILALKPSAPADTSQQHIFQDVEGDQVIAPANPIRDVFGAAVHPIAFKADGSLLASAGTQAANYFHFDSAGELKKKWLGKYAIHPTQSGLWIRDWWGVPGYVEKVVRADHDAQPLWMMDSPRYRRSFQFWKHPGRRSIPSVDRDDLFVSGHRQLSRITSEGKVVWRYDDLPTAEDVESFRFSRDIMLYDASDDGRYLLAAAFGVEPYANVVARFVRPSVMLFDAQRGKIIWGKPDVLIDHSACRFAGQRVIVADATPGRKRVMLLDLAGRELWTKHRSEGTSKAALSPDGTWLVVRPEAPRGANFQTLGPPRGLAAIRLEDGQTRPFPITGRIHAWSMAGQEGLVLVSTDDGYLRSFKPDGTLLWERDVHGVSNPLVSRDGSRIAVGTSNGLLMLLDAQGDLLRKIDLMPHNIVEDPDQYVRQYTASPRDVPVVDPLPAPPPRIDERCRREVHFSANLLEQNPAFESLEGKPLDSLRTLKFKAAEAGTYVLSITQRNSGGADPAAGTKLRATIHRAGEPKPVYSAELPVSAAWQERTAAWKLGGPGSFELTIEPVGEASGAGTEIRGAAVFHVAFPSANLLAQKTLDAPGDPLSNTAATDIESLLSGEASKPPSVRFFMPNDVDLTARSRGAAPFPKTIDFTQPFNGRIDDAKTSWRAKPLSGSTHGLLELKFKTPVAVASLAVYEDSADAARYTDTFALFVREAKSGRWRQAGHVIDNRNPFNLFTFPAAEIDAVTYLWLKSADGHARVAELEAYRPRARLGK